MQSFSLYKEKEWEVLEASMKFLSEVLDCFLDVPEYLVPNLPQGERVIASQLALGQCDTRTFYFN